MSSWIVCCGDPSAAGLIAPPPRRTAAAILPRFERQGDGGSTSSKRGRLPPAPRPCGRLLPPTRTPNRWPVGWAVFGARHDEGRTGLGRRRRLSRAPFIVSSVSRRFSLSLVVFPWFRALRRAFFFRAGLRGGCLVFAVPRVRRHPPPVCVPTPSPPRVPLRARLSLFSVVLSHPLPRLA